MIINYELLKLSLVKSSNSSGPPNRPSALPEVVDESPGGQKPRPEPAFRSLYGGMNGGLWRFMEFNTGKYGLMGFNSDYNGFE